MWISKLASVLFLAASSCAFGQALDTPYQINYFPNLNIPDSAVNMVNSGSNGVGNPAGTAGRLCVNTYVFAPSGTMQACCACLLGPNAMASYSVQRDLVSNTLTKPAPAAVAVKILATLAGATGSGSTCNAGQAGSAGWPLATGLSVWGVKLHQSPSGGDSEKEDGKKGEAKYTITETPFTPSTLSAGELASLNQQCTAIGAGPAGVCAACRVGGR